MKKGTLILLTLLLIAFQSKAQYLKIKENTDVTCKSVGEDNGRSWEMKLLGGEIFMADTIDQEKARVRIEQLQFAIPKDRFEKLPIEQMDQLDSLKKEIKAHLKSLIKKQLVSGNKKYLISASPELKELTKTLKVADRSMERLGIVRADTYLVDQSSFDGNFIRVIAPNAPTLFIHKRSVGNTEATFDKEEFEHHLRLSNGQYILKRKGKDGWVITDREYRVKHKLDTGAVFELNESKSVEFIKTGWREIETDWLTNNLGWIRWSVAILLILFLFFIVWRSGRVQAWLDKLYAPPSSESKNELVYPSDTSPHQPGYDKGIHQKLAEMSSQIHAVGQAVEELRTSGKSSSHELKEVRKEKEQLKNDLAKAESDLAELRQENSDLLHKLSDERSQANEFYFASGYKAFLHAAQETIRQIAAIRAGAEHICQQAITNDPQGTNASFLQGALAHYYLRLEPEAEQQWKSILACLEMRGLVLDASLRSLLEKQTSDGNADQMLHHRFFRDFLRNQLSALFPLLEETTHLRQFTGSVAGLEGAINELEGLRNGLLTHLGQSHGVQWSRVRLFEKLVDYKHVNLNDPPASSRYAGLSVAKDHVWEILAFGYQTDFEERQPTKVILA